jgi:hypothetical protein
MPVLRANTVGLDPRAAQTACERVDWVHPAQDRNHWLAFVDTVMNFRVP